MFAAVAAGALTWGCSAGSGGGGGGAAPADPAAPGEEIGGGPNPGDFDFFSPGMEVGQPVPSGAGDFGATQGGVQDMGLARELIAGGRVPPAEAFVVEGMFSEHELGLDGEPCQRTLCLRTALGVAPTLDGTASGWLQVGLSSVINLEEYERPSVTLIATVDVSGSMGWGYATPAGVDPTPGEVARNLLSALAAELGPQDQIAIVTYGTTVATVLELTGGDEQFVIQAVIDSLGTDGSTNMEGGMRQAYDLAREAEANTDEVRVMVFTDVRPNVGVTSATEFEQLAREGADDGIGLTVMAVGLGLGQEVLNAMSQVRGANAFSLFDNEDVTELMDDDWPWLLSPIAYDLSVELTPEAGFAVAEAYGFPSSEDEESTGLEVSSVFLSRRKGALLVRLAPDDDAKLSDLAVAGRLAYTTPEGRGVEEDLEAAYNGEPLDAGGRYFEQDSVGKTVALALLVEAMHDAAEIYSDNQDAAVTVMRAGLERFKSDAEALRDPALTPEIELAKDLLQLMQEGAEQGDLYGFGGQQ